MRMVAKIPPYTLFIVDDTAPQDPRQNYEHLGEMICFHSRYRLGDAHHFESSKDFLQSVLAHSYTIPFKQMIGNLVVDYLKAGMADNIALTYNRSSHEWELQEKLAYENNWYVSSSYPAPLRGNNISERFFNDCLSALEVEDLLKLSGRITGLILLPLYLYDHSGITINTAAYSCPWDSGQVGWIYVSPDKIFKEYGNLKPDTLAIVQNILENEVKEYDAYLTGECYGFELYRDDMEIESCYGYLGDVKIVKQEARRILPSDCDVSIIDLL